MRLCGSTESDLMNRIFSLRFASHCSIGAASLPNLVFQSRSCGSIADPLALVFRPGRLSFSASVTKKLFFTTTGLLALATSAFAADLPANVPLATKAPYVAPVIFSRTGC